jgi:multiple sugar transport system permease protein
MVNLQRLMGPHRRGPNALVRAALYLFLLVGSTTMIGPFLWMVSTSLKTQDQVFRYPPLVWPPQPRWANYIEALQYADFGRYFLNSVIVSTTRTVGVVFFAALAGFALAKLRFRGRNLVFYGIVATMMVPYVINIVPVYILLSRLRWPGPWLDSYWGVVVPQLGNAFGIFLMRQFMRDLPTELIEAARMDGCSEFRIFWQIALPLAKPALSALAIFTFVSTWNDFTWPLIVLNSEAMKTIPLGIATFRSPWSNLRAYEMAVTTLACLPAFLVFMVLRRQFTEGIALTGLKG